MVAADESGQQARLAELRRRLYAPDATAADRERYVALRDEVAAATRRRSASGVAPTSSEPAPDAAPVVTRAPRRRPLLIASALLGVAGLCAAIVLLQSPPRDPDPLARASETTSPQAALPAQSRAPQLSERFSDDAETPVGTTVEVSVDGGRVLAQRFSGSGPATVPLITGGAPLSGGLLTVTLRSTAGNVVSWQTVSATAQSPAATSTPEPPAVGLASPDSTSVRYRGAPPARIDVEAPAGVGWTLVVAFSR